MMRKIAGGTVLALPLVAVGVLCFLSTGLLGLLIVFGSSAAIIGCIIGGSKLLWDR